jgi:HAD superfamily hydrolase (TIGR01509 family)
MIRRFRHWIFDLDGTLTVSTHDFAGIRAELGLPPNLGLIEALDRLPPAEAEPRRARLAEWELYHANQASAEPDAAVLLAALVRSGARIGVLTRNRRDIALHTLWRAGLAEGVVPEDCLGRDCAIPKPSGDGIRRLAARWGVPTSEIVMVGDFRYDLEAARDAGAAAVLVDRDGSAGDWAILADHRVDRLDRLLD